MSVIDFQSTPFIPINTTKYNYITVYYIKLKVDKLTGPLSKIGKNLNICSFPFRQE